MGPPPRTNKTDLTTPEVLLLDGLFEFPGASLHALSTEHYSFHLNCLYDHGLDDDALQQTMTDLAERGLIELKAGEDGRPGYWLSRIGGYAWETERSPDWDRYCADHSHHGNEGGNMVLGVACRQESVGRAFVEVGRACGLFSFNPEVLTVSPGSPDDSLAYWRPAEKIVVIEVPLLGNHAAAVNWKYYEQHRVWWRSIAELIRKEADSGK